MIVFLDLQARDILSEEHFGYLIEVMEGMGRQRENQSEATPFKLYEKVRHMIGSLQE